MDEVTPSTGESDAARVSSVMSQVGKSWYPSWKTFERAHACMVLQSFSQKYRFTGRSVVEWKETWRWNSRHPDLLSISVAKEPIDSHTEEYTYPIVRELSNTPPGLHVLNVNKQTTVYTAVNTAKMFPYMLRIEKPSYICFAITKEFYMCNASQIKTIYRKIKISPPPTNPLSLYQDCCSGIFGSNQSILSSCCPNHASLILSMPGMNGLTP